MPKKFDYSPDKFAELRKHAMSLLEKYPKMPASSVTDIKELIEELNIHQTELYIQNVELKASQQELMELSRKYEMLYEFAPCGYVTLTPEGIISRINRAGLEILGENNIKLNITEFGNHVEFAWTNLFYAAIKNAALTGEHQSLDLNLKTDSKMPLWIHLGIDAYQDEQEQVIEWRLVFMDISQKRFAQAALQESQARFEIELARVRKLEAVGVLAGGIAHDFNNILQPIIGYSELSLEALPEDSAVRENIEEILKGSKRAVDLVRQILTFSSQKSKAPEPVMVQGIFKEVASFLRSTIPANIDIQMEISPDPIYILSDSIQLHEIAMNICTNAYQAMDKDGGLLSIRVTAVELDTDQTVGVDFVPGRYCLISIQDSGPGIPGHVIDRIFDPYFTTKAFGKGSGMGLSVVHGIVKEHKGHIKVASEPGRTVFDIYFPITDQMQKEEIFQKSFDMSTHHETILFVDDEISIVKLITKSLERLGYKMIGKTSSLDALNEFGKHPDKFDLVITDMSMPGMMGTELIAKIKKIRPDIMAVICTGYSSRINKGNIQSFNIDDFIYKPVSIRELSAKIRTLLDQIGKD